MPRRFSYAEYEILHLLRAHPTRKISYDDMAAEIGTLDRRTLITAMRRLEYKRKVVVIRGRGCTPNRYYLTERVFVA